MHIFAKKSIMKKTKLISARTQRSFTQQQLADKLHMDVSNYSRREKGQIKISLKEWEKLAEILNVPIEDIYEAEENMLFVFKDSSTGNYLGTNHFYSIPEHLLETQRKYIQKLEEEIQRLKNK